MRKVLIIAWSDSILDFFSQADFSLFNYDFLILKKNQSYDFGKLDEQFIYVDEQMLPVKSFLPTQSSDELLTLAQKQTRKKNLTLVEKVFNSLNQSQQIKLFQRKNKIENSIIGLSQAGKQNWKSEVYAFDQINDIKTDQQKKKVFLELKNSPVVEYDHVLIEKSDLVFAELEDKKIYKKTLFKTNSDESYVWSGIRFKVNVDLNQSFWLIDDSDYDSVYDNVLHVKPYQQGQDFFVDAWSWLLHYHKDNPEMLRFWKKRIQEKILRHISFLQITETEDSFIYQPLTSHAVAKLKSNNSMTFFDPFAFKNAEQIQNEIARVQQTVVQKMKKIKTEALSNTEARL